MSDYVPDDEAPETASDEIIPEGPEADLQEQSQLVGETRSFSPTDKRDDVPEADWFEQSIAETPDEEER